jgi:DMSO reductase anchor subunit
MREMGYVVGRRHADKLRLIALGCGFAVPIFALLLILPAPSLAGLWAVVAVISMAIGLLVERWLFFAEAQHVVTLYYGASRA